MIAPKRVHACAWVLWNECELSMKLCLFTSNAVKEIFKV
jgi:hypothetical protein